MAEMLIKKRAALELLLHEMEEFEDAVLEGRFDALEGAVKRRDAIVETIRMLDREAEIVGKSESYSRGRLEELKALVARLVKINDSLIAAIKKQAGEVQQELNTLHRRAEAASGYRKQANVKV